MTSWPVGGLSGRKRSTFYADEFNPKTSKPSNEEEHLVAICLFCKWNSSIISRSILPFPSADLSEYLPSNSELQFLTGGSVGNS